MSKYLVLGLVGDMQSYGTTSKFYMRTTDSHPSKSAVIGMILASTGWFIPDDSTLRKLSSGYMESESYGDGSPRIMRDFQMMGASHERNDWDEQFCLVKGDPDPTKKAQSTVKLSYRDYIVGAKFRVIIEVHSDLVDHIVTKLQDPEDGPFLGRRTCIPSEPVYRATCDSLEEAREIELFPNKKLISRVVEGIIGEHEWKDGLKYDTSFTHDVPIKMGYIKEYSGRYITVIRSK